LRKILTSEESWCIPYVLLLLGEYVIEIIQDIAAALPTLNKAAYVNFIRENRPLMALLRERATSYWNLEYRYIQWPTYFIGPPADLCWQPTHCRGIYAYKDRNDYPGLIALNELERWAA
jgi:hypothetical protein